VRIDQLTIQNFRGFELGEFEFNPHFNLVVGDNATGKTSLLDALSIGVGRWFMGVQGYEEAPPILTDQVRVVAHAYQDRWSFDTQNPVRIAIKALVMGNNLSWELLLASGRGSLFYHPLSIVEAATSAEQAAKAGKPITLPLICTYFTDRLGDTSSHEEKNASQQLPSRLDGYRNSIHSRIHESALLNWIRAEVSASQQRGSETIAYRIVRRAIIACAEGAESLYYDERYRDLVVSIKSFGQQLFRNLSEGQRIMLSLVGDLARRATTLNPHLGDDVLQQTPGVVAIDELDLHLHPKWQRHVIRDLKATFPSLQFIATTHSPQLIGEALPEEIIGLGRQGAEHPAQSFGMDSNWVLRHVMGADDRDHEVKARLEEIENLINNFHLTAAQAKIDALRSEIGNHPDLVRYSARIDRFARKAQ